MIVLEKKIDFHVILKVVNANPNGDPLNGNRPRINYDGIGEISDVCIKRKIRDRLIENGHSVFVQSDDRRVDEHKTLRDRAEAVLNKNLFSDKAKEFSCKEWFDVRAFGQLFAFKKVNKNKSSIKKDEDTEDLETENSVSIGIRGPVSIHSAYSIKPLEVTTIQITKSVSGEGDGKKKASDTMGLKHRIDSGIYKFVGSMNPQLAEKTGFSNEDAEVIKNILPKLFENDASSARPEGSMSILSVIWWEHSCKSGDCSSAKVHGSVDISDDGKVTISPDFINENPKIKHEIIHGF
jgi:CRISPR-associated protein Csd2